MSLPPEKVVGTRPPPNCAHAQEGWYCFVTNKTIKIFLSLNKFIEACQWQTPRILNWFIDIFGV